MRWAHTFLLNGLRSHAKTCLPFPPLGGHLFWNLPLPQVTCQLITTNNYTTRMCNCFHTLLTAIKFGETILFLWPFLPNLFGKYVSSGSGLILFKSSGKWSRNIGKKKIELLLEQWVVTSKDCHDFSSPRKTWTDGDQQELRMKHGIEERCSSELQKQTSKAWSWSQKF